MSAALSRSFDLNVKGNDYVVGDIHGCFSLLQQKLDALEFNPEVDRLFSVGDLVDRGNESDQAVEWLNKEWFYPVLGNHEDMAMEYYKYLVSGEAEDVPYVQNYVQNGGAWFITMPMEQKKEFVFAFAELPLAINVETKDGLVGIVHASCFFEDWSFLMHVLDGAVEMTESEWGAVMQGLIWDRELIRTGDKSVIANVHKVYHGHTPTNRVVELGNRVYIDTGAVYTRQLTIVKL